MAGMKNSRAITNLDAYADDMDLGTTNAQGRFRGYTGSIPTTLDDFSATTLLFECLGTVPGSGGVFGSAVDTTPGARVTANPIFDDTSADATGTLGFIIGVDRNGTPRHLYTVGTSGAECILASLSIVAGQTIQWTSLTVSQSEGP